MYFIEKSERPMSFSSKEFLNINKTLLLLRKIFLFLPDRIRVGWQRWKIGILSDYHQVFKNRTKY